MDSYHDRINREINEQLDLLAEEGASWKAEWVANAICKSHQGALREGEGSEFWLWTSYRSVRDMVRRQINVRAGDEADRPERHQIELKGFDRDRLQDYYLVERDGEALGVPVTDLTDAEISQKAGNFRAMANACHEHANELMRFKAWRSSTRPLVANEPV